MHAHYLTADVFTDRAFGGNPLAVFPDARDIPGELMQAIAREFNYSETTFVLPPVDPSHAARVRIFTPGGELPFAGHPTVGTAHVLASIGAIELTGETTHVIFEEGVGDVPIVIRRHEGRPGFAQLTAAKLPETGPDAPDARSLAAMLSLSGEDLAGEGWLPETVSCGVPFLFVPLRDRDAVGRARLDLSLWQMVLGGYATSMVFVFALGGERAGSDLRGRMFAPGIGVAEDPATGSAAVALGGYLATRASARSGTLRWVLEQGFEMGRPSILEIEVEKVDGRVTASRVGGNSAIVCEGRMLLPAR